MTFPGIRSGGTGLPFLRRDLLASGASDHVHGATSSLHRGIRRRRTADGLTLRPAGPLGHRTRGLGHWQRTVAAAVSYAVDITTSTMVRLSFHIG